MHVLTHDTYSTHTMYFLISSKLHYEGWQGSGKYEKAWKSRADVSWQDRKDGQETTAVIAKLKLKLQPLFKNTFRNARDFLPILYIENKSEFDILSKDKYEQGEWLQQEKTVSWAPDCYWWIFLLLLFFALSRHVEESLKKKKKTVSQIWSGSFPKSNWSFLFSISTCMPSVIKIWQLISELYCQ